MDGCYKTANEARLSTFKYSRTSLISFAPYRKLPKPVGAKIVDCPLFEDKRTPWIIGAVIGGIANTIAIYGFVSFLLN